MTDEALQVPKQPATSSGAEARSRGNTRVAAGWQGAIAAAVSPALLPLTKVRDGSRKGLPQPDQAARATDSSPALKSVNLNGENARHTRLVGRAAVDTAAAEKEEHAARTVALIESLRPDNTGDDVKDLQKRLGLASQGTYGPITFDAVKKYAVGDEFSRINAELKTGIDFNSLLEYEGFSLDGYVPNVRGSKSGVTIGVGFDIGQFSEAEIKAFGLPDELTKKLLPYAGLMLKDAEEKLRETGGLTVSVRDVREITRAVKKDFAQYVSAKYDRSRSEGVPTFSELTPAQQTVIFSRFFHQGRSFTEYENAKPWWTGVTTGNWADVQSNLRNYPFAKKNWYKARVGKEADLLGNTSVDTEKK